MRLLRLARTLRYLRPVQIYGRLWYMLYRPRPVRRQPLGIRRRTGAWLPGCRRHPTMVAADTFRFLNVTGRVRSSRDWNSTDQSRLWRYNLHYFDDLNASDAEARSEWHRALVSRWVRENPPTTGTGWESYPTSLRIANWIKWMLGTGSCAQEMADQVLDSLATQARWLHRRTEVHLQGNHLWANGKALVFAGACFDGDEPRRWLRRGLGIVERGLLDQILPDGGHFERSPMYHAVVLEDVLDLVNLSRVYPHCFRPELVGQLRITASRMLRWLFVMTHPDGQIALFNDSALGTAPTAAELAAYASILDVPADARPLDGLQTLPDSGYVRLQVGRAAAICDVAAIGPDYQPAHAHADTLSFELSVDGDRVVVNTGTSTYESGAERQRQRGTAAHNTVEVEHQDSSEVWGGFRVARRARPVRVRWGQGDGRLWVEGAHDGYRRLPGRVTHWRRWTLADDELVVEDRLAGRFRSARMLLHLHPTVRVSMPNGPHRAVCSLPMRSGANLHISVDPPAELSLESDTWHPRFGETQDSAVLTAAFVTNSITARLNWR